MYNNLKQHKSGRLDKKLLLHDNTLSYIYSYDSYIIFFFSSGCKYKGITEILIKGRKNMRNTTLLLILSRYSTVYKQKSVLCLSDFFWDIPFFMTNCLLSLLSNSIFRFFFCCCNVSDCFGWSLFKFHFLVGLASYIFKLVNEKNEHFQLFNTLVQIKWIQFVPIKEK